MDMPPQQVVEYRMERPAPRQDGAVAGVARFMEASQARDELRAAAMHTADLPDLDRSSKALTPAERSGLAAARDAIGKGRLAKLVVDMPDGYVKQRIEMSVMQMKLQERRDPIGLAEAQRFRCAVVANLMDRRAAAYVEGGARSAAEGRATVGVEDVQACRGVMAQAARLAAAPKVRVDFKAPAPMGKSGSAGERLAGVDPALASAYAAAGRGRD